MLHRNSKLLCLVLPSTIICILMLFISCLFSPSVVEADITTGLVAHWELDEGSGTIVADSAGTNTGTLINGPVWTTGNIGTNALIFDGADDYINVPSSVTIQNIWDGGGTVAFWVKPNSAGEADQGFWLTKSLYWRISPYGFHTAGQTGLIFNIDFDNTAQWSTDTTSPEVAFNNQWHHIVLTYNSDSTNNEPSLYIDGTAVSLPRQVAPTGTRSSEAGTSLQIGSNDGESRASDGAMDDIRFYNRELSASDALQLYYASDTAKPIISSTASSTTATTATISWTTDELATSTVAYGETASYDTASTSATLVTSHSITITGLTQATLYHFQVGSADAAGNIATSSDLTFTTTAPDIEPPFMSSVASSTTATTATISWTTDELATSTVDYGETAGYGAASTSATLVTSHSVTLTGLTASTVYHFQISSGDASNNFGTSSDYTFMTDDPPRHYIRAGATGNNDGSDWTNAWESFADASWTRGDTYYVATGVYAEDVSVTKAESGSLWIHIKKAIAADHGSSTGWQDSYGTGAAEIDGKLIINSAYIDWDGQVGSDDSGHGFIIANQIVGGHVAEFYPDKSHIYLRHTELRGTGSPGTNPANNTQEMGLYILGQTLDGADDIQISYCWIHAVNRDGVVLGSFTGSPGLLFEHNRIERTGHHADPDAHGQGMQFALYGTTTGAIIRFNKFIDIDGSADIAFLGGYTLTDMKIYGNIFWSTDIVSYTSSPGVIWTREGTPNVTVNGLYIYNNTFHNITLAQIANDAAVSSNAYVRNNIWEGSIFTGTGSVHRGVTADHNYYFGNTDTPPDSGSDQAGVSTAFLDSSNHDYHLVSASLAKDTGVDLGSPYNLDFDGNLRPQDAAWDIGAFESITDATAPTISSISSGTPIETSATITWTTNELSTSQVEFGFTATYTSSSTLDSSLTTSHSVVLSGLTADSTYHYRVLSEDGYGNVTTSSDQVFTTADISPQDSSQNIETHHSSSGISIRLPAVAPISALYPGATTTAPTFARSLTIGDIGIDVKDLQLFLNSHGFVVAINGPGSFGQETIFFGRLTRDALARFQKANHIMPAVGFFGPLTMTAIASLTSNAPAVQFQFMRDLSLGSVGSDVKALQQYLNTHGFPIALAGPGSFGNETERFGTFTRTALIKFQQANGITPVSGYFGPKTRARVTEKP